MITYSSIALKDDKIFMSIARKVLRSDFDMVVDDASSAFQSAYHSESNSLHKANAARRAANLVILGALKEYGVTNWRELTDNNKQPPSKRVPVKPVTNSGVKLKGKKWDGASILEMAEANKLKRSK